MISAKPMNKSTIKSKQTWHLVTNHQNLLYMLASGLIMEPSEFGNKHYTDVLSLAPGWIPLFKKSIPASALKLSCSEAAHLRCCVITLDLSNVQGLVKIVSNTEKFRDADFPKIRLGKSDAALLIKAPLPLALCTSISFASEQDKKDYEVAATNISNANPHLFEINIKKYTDEAVDNGWPRASTLTSFPAPFVKRTKQVEFSFGETSPKSINPHLSAQSFGGILCMLFHSAAKGSIGLNTLKNIDQFFNNSEHHSAIDSNKIKITDHIIDWLSGVNISEQADISVKLYWEIVDAVAKGILDKNPSSAVDIVLNYLNSRLDKTTSASEKSRLRDLLNDMQNITGLHSKNISQLFDDNPKPLARALLLFCLRNTCTELLEFSHPDIGEDEFVLASILFGLRDRWLGIPIVFRGKIISPYITGIMSRLEHRKIDSDIQLPKIPLPLPLRSLFPTKEDQWPEPINKIAINFAKANQWSDCFETVISSSDHQPLKPRRGSQGQLHFAGIVDVSTQIIPTAFIRRLCTVYQMNEASELKTRSELTQIQITDVPCA